MKITIHQPDHLPYAGFFDKVNKADIFVVLDTAQFKKNYFHNRNRARTNSPNGFSWLTVPIKSHPLDTPINHIEIADSAGWRERYLNIIQENYKRAPYFERYFSPLRGILEKRHKKLAELNIDLMLFLLRELDTQTEIVKSSEMDLKEAGKGTERLVSICKELNASEYISGVSGRDYLQMDLFGKEDIKVVFQEFKHSVYRQQYEPFMPNMSVIDILFNLGPEEFRKLFKNER